MKRKVYDILLDWKKKRNGEVALMIEGARRVGKSYIVEEFAKNEYDSFIIVDFNHIDNEMQMIFDENLSNLDQFFRLLELKTKTKLINRKSLIVFDEVQLYPKARAAIKYLVKDGRYDYIETGSLVSIKRNSRGIVIPSEERKVEMYPMDFEEFLWALGEDMLVPYIKECFEDKKPVGALHRKISELLRLYMIIGGMPQAVQKYVDSKDFESVDLIKRDILQLYRDDINQYADEDRMKVLSIFDSIPGQLQRHEKKFKLSDISSNARMRQYETSFMWLSEAKVINCCYNTTEPSLGLRMNDDRTTVKCYMADTGLLISHAFDEKGLVDEEIYMKLLLGKLETNEGMILENLVAQMLRAKGHSLYFYSNSSRNDTDSRMEIDFLIAKSKITNKHNISPIEVKSGKNLSHASLDKCIRKYSNYLSTPYLIYDGDFKIEDGIVYLPVYMTMLL